jgi:hypothetical protein
MRIAFAPHGNENLGYLPENDVCREQSSMVTLTDVTWDTSALCKEVATGEDL